MFAQNRRTAVMARLMAHVNLEESGEPHEWPESHAVETVAEDGIAYRVTDRSAGLTVIVFEAGDEAPAGYPDDFPFVPHVRVALVPADAPMLSWLGVDRVEQVTDLVLQQSIADGWQLGPVGEIPYGGGGRIARLEKRGAKRCIMGMKAMRAVNLADRPAAA